MTEHSPRMERAPKAINRLTAVGAGTLLVLSAWPGYAGGCFGLLALPLIGILGVAWVVVVGRWLPRPWGRSASLSARRILVAPMLVLVTYTMLKFYVPRRVVFAVARGAFERHLASAPQSEYRGKPLGWVGIYRVDEYAADPRGGTYFGTGTGPDGIDVMSYGFVYRPNPNGTPFGAAHYRVHWLGGEWYWFQASDDWY